MTRLELENVTVELGRRKLLEAINLRVSSGEFVAIVGANGAGKTTLLRTALGLLTPSQGRVLVDGDHAASLKGRARAARLAWLPQQLVASEPLSALEVVLAARYRFDESRAEAQRQAHAALERLRIAELALKRIDRLSGGERQRVALAALLAQESSLLLVDEPANHLDPGQQAETYRLLGELWTQGYGIICVTHDVNLLAYAGRAADLRVLGLASGAVVFERAYAAADLAPKLGALFGIAIGCFQAGERRFFIPELGGAGS
ncbi:MAG TPA: ABC transporter ATP-binding protein [Polyangiaceae bacterium]|nr:ABC transporter ATP-binding protein [Polyangiaceae bacterium]